MYIEFCYIVYLKMIKSFFDFVDLKCILDSLVLYLFNNKLYYKNSGLFVVI